MRIVVTGASGFIGGHLARALTAERQDVLGVARSSAVGIPWVCVKDYDDAPAGDLLFHLADTRDRQVVASMGATYAATAVKTVEALLRKGFGRIIYVSSAAVYGDLSCEPHSPDERIEPQDMYARVKYACESRVLEAGGVVARLSNVYGINMARTNVVSTVLNQIPGAGALQVYDAQPIRDFVCVTDVVCALVSLIQSGGASIYNIGTGVGTSIHELARLALRLAGETDRETISTNPAGRPSCTILDITKTRADLGWSPQTSLATGIERLLRERSVSPARA